MDINIYYGTNKVIPRLENKGVNLTRNDLEGIVKNKDLFLFDLFETIIPSKKVIKKKSQSREEKINHILTQELRKGFEDIVKTCKKKIYAVHSDGIKTEDLKNINKYWGQPFSYCFGEEYNFDINKKIKDFDRMINEVGIKKDKAIIIDDGKSGLIPAIYFGIDIIIVPNYNEDNKFNYVNEIKMLKNS